MGKLGGLILVSVLALTGCATTQAAPPSTSRAEVQPVSVKDSAKVQSFVKAIQDSRGGYSNLPAQDIADMAPELCEHYAAGFTTEDLRESSGEKLAQAGEAARHIVCPAKK